MAVGFVRPAHFDDADEIARIELATWRAAYRRLLPRRVLDSLDLPWMARRWHEAIDQPPTGRHRVLVAVEQADQAYLVGFAASGPADADALAPDEADQAEPPMLDGSVAAVIDLLVEPRWGRRGHGSRLLAASVEAWRGDGMRTAVAWTFVEDQVTNQFLGSAGWQPDGRTRALDVDDLLVAQQRWHVAVAADDATLPKPATRSDRP